MATKLSSQIILVVGGSGFLGHHMIQDLIGSGVHPTQIHILDLNASKISEPGLTYHCTDITRSPDVQRVLQLVKPGVVFHMVSPYPFAADRALLERVNITGTSNLISAAQKAGSVKAFVYTSSSSVIHDPNRPLCNADENYPILYFPEQPNYYSYTKAVAEDIVLAANRKVDSRMPTVAIRPASMYGEGDTIQIPNLVKTARTGRAGLQIGKGDNKFDNTYIKNLTHAQILAAEALLEAANSAPLSDDKRVEGEAFFVTDDDPYTFPGYTRLVAEFSGHPVKPNEIRSIPLWLMLVLVYMAGWMYWAFTFGTHMDLSTSVIRMLAQERTFNIEKIKNRLGYRPRFSTAEGTKRAVEWHIAHESEITGKKAQ